MAINSSESVGIPSEFAAGDRAIRTQFASSCVRYRTCELLLLNGSVCPMTAWKQERLATVGLRGDHYSAERPELDGCSSRR